jgi:hypothetical protein
VFEQRGDAVVLLAGEAVGPTPEDAVVDYQQVRTRVRGAPEGLLCGVDRGSDVLDVALSGPDL